MRSMPKFNVKQMEEFQEDYLLALAKMTLISNNQLMNELILDPRYLTWKENDHYEYMRLQCERWSSFLTSYKENKKRVINVIDYDSIGRKNGKKADIVLTFEDGTTDPISLKTLKKGGTIQTNSSTFFSFILSLIFDRIGPGKFTYNNEILGVRQVGKIRTVLVQNGYSLWFIENLLNLKNTSKELFDFVSTNPNFFDMKYLGLTNTIINGEMKTCAWSKKCEDVREKYKPVLLRMINEIILNEGLESVTKKSLTTQGILGDHSTVVVSTSQVTYISHKDLDISGVNMSIEECSEGLRFTFIGEGLNCVSTIPLTINRNGAYNLDLNRDNEYFKTDKTHVKYGMIRPIKSKQIATSTNTYIKIQNFQ